MSSLTEYIKLSIFWTAWVNYYDIIILWRNWVALPPKIMHYLKMVESHFSLHYDCHINKRKQAAFQEHCIYLEPLRFPSRICHIIKQKFLV